MSAQSFDTRITVVTPCLNGALYIGEAIESVLQQGHPYTEHIVADGGSSDGTLDILKQYKHLKVLSCADRGIYDGLNRGLALAHGELIGILNSDDCYAKDVFASIIEAFRDENVMAVGGEAVTFRCAPNGEQIAVDRFAPVGIDLLFHATLGNPAINAWFFRAAVFAKIGQFDASYRIAGDREFMLRFACSGLPYAALSKLVYRYRIHTGSLTFGGNEQIGDTVVCEHTRIADLYLGKLSVSKRARELVRQAHTRDTLAGAFYFARQHNVRKLIQHAAAGTRHDPVWPARFAKRALRGLAWKNGLRDRTERT